MIKLGALERLEWFVWFLQGWVATVRFYNVAWVCWQAGAIEVGNKCWEAAEAGERIMMHRLYVALGRDQDVYRQLVVEALPPYSLDRMDDDGAPHYC